MDDQIIDRIEKDIDFFKENDLGVTPWQTILSIGATLAGIITIAKGISAFSFTPTILAFSTITILLQVPYVFFFSSFEKRSDPKKGNIPKSSKNSGYKIPLIGFKIAPLIVQGLLLTALPISLATKICLFLALGSTVIPWLILLIRQLKAQFSFKLSIAPKIDRNIWFTSNLFSLLFVFQANLLELITRGFPETLNCLLLGGFLAILWLLLDILYLSTIKVPQISQLYLLKDDIVFGRITSQQGLIELRQIKEGLTIEEYYADDFNDFLEFLSEADTHISDYKREFENSHLRSQGEKDELPMKTVKKCEILEGIVSKKSFDLSSKYSEAERLLNRGITETLEKRSLIENTYLTNLKIKRLEAKIVDKFLSRVLIDVSIIAAKSDLDAERFISRIFNQPKNPDE